jgi:CubicO group peptidase (beta-lactamase class C family)
MRAWAYLAILVALLLWVTVPSQAAAASWTDPGYLYRYGFWGIPLELSKSDAYRRFPFRTVENGPQQFHFAKRSKESIPEIVEYREGNDPKRVALRELLQSTGTHAFIVIRNGDLLYENYLNGYARDSLNESWSLAKSVVSALIGIAIAEGRIKGVNDPITNYLPELKDQGITEITIRDLLTMGSGIRYRFGLFPWDEFVMYGFYPDLRKLMFTDLTIVEPPGQSFHYNNYNTELCAMVLERATGRSLGEYLQEKVWKPLGMEYQAIWSLDHDGDGIELAATLLEARAIDFAKFGQLYLDKGKWNGVQVVPEQWVEESTTPDPKDLRPWQTFSQWQDGGGYYKYFWWGTSPRPGDYTFQGIGTYGQFIFVSPARRVVIVRMAAKDGIEPLAWRDVFHFIADHVGSN